jgi:hypothetical protein
MLINVLNLIAQVEELGYSVDLKSTGYNGHVGSNPTLSTNRNIFGKNH